MSGEIQDIVDKLVAIQKAIVAPAGEKKIAQAYDEPPAQVTAFPSFVTVEEGIPQIGRSNGLRRQTWTIAMHLLFASADQKYSVRSRRKWVKAVLDAFDVSLVLTLAQPPVQYAPITNVTFDPYQLGETQYVTATFWMQVQTVEAFTFDA